MDNALLMRPSGIARVLAVVAVGVAGIAAWWLPSGDDVGSLAVTFWAVWALCLVVLVRGHPQGVYGPAAAYLVLFGLFHGGLLMGCAVQGADCLGYQDAGWVHDVHTPTAVSLAVLGMAAFTAAAAVSGFPPSGFAAPPERPAPEPRPLGVVGVTVQVLGLGVFAAAVLRTGGADLLSGGYQDFVEANQYDSALAFGVLFAGVGAVLAVAAGGTHRVIGWAGFGMYALVAFPLGTRGEVLFPLLAMLVVEVRRRPIRLKWTLLGAGVVLLLIGLVRQTRLAGLSALGTGSWFAAPLDAVAEMGFSLRPVVVVAGWHAASEPSREGATLVAVPVRFLESLAGWGGGPPEYDDRLFNVEIADRVGQIGGSPVAESFHNFGVLGVLLFMACLGVVLGRLERRPSTVWNDAVLGVVLFPLLVGVRNSFAPVPVQIACALVLVGAARVVAAGGSR